MLRAKRGEVWLVDLGYAAKTRPCLVLNQFEDIVRFWLGL